MWNFKSIFAAVAVAATAMLGSCAFDPNTLSTDPELQSLIDNSAALQETDIADSTTTSVNGAPSPTYTGWARTSWSIDTNTLTVVNHDAGAGTATIKITRTIKGVLKVSSNWSQFQAGGTLATKPFTMEKIRFANFEKKAGKWRLTGLSFATATSPSATVGITSVSVFNSTNGTTPLVTVDATKMTNIFTLDTLPALASSQLVKVTATVTANSGVTPLVYLHHGEKRILMHDDGVNGGDSVSGDKTYSCYAYAGSAAFKHFHIDTIDQATIDLTGNTNNYSSAIWNGVFKAP